MAEVAHATPADRARALVVGMHPRGDGELVLTPDDLMEGKGNFANIDAQGNPEGFRLVEPPVPDARNVYAGTSPENLTKQNVQSLGLERSSYLLNHPLVRGDELPTQGQQLARLARPGKPILKKLKAANAGYAPGTPSSPHWFCFSWYKRGNHTLLGPPVSAESANGQSFRIALPETSSIGEGADGVGIWMAAPGTSTATRPGPFFLQRALDLKVYGLPYFDLTGPYRYALYEPDEDETRLPIGGGPGVRFIRTNIASQIGTYYFCMTWARGSGAEEGLQGPVFGPYEVEGSTYYNDPDTPVGQIPEMLGGYGYFRVTIPNAPTRDATGYYLYVMVGDEWHRAYDKRTGEGRTKPWGLDKESIGVAGWGPGSEYGANDNVLIEGHDPPEMDLSGIEPPDSAPEAPEAFGAARPDSGTYYFRTTDEHNGLESLPSAIESIEIGNLDVVRCVFASPVNDIPNATFVEKAADGLPLDHTVVKTGGDARLEGGELVLETNGAQTGATPTVANEDRAVDRTTAYEVFVHFRVENPKSGALQGQVNAVLEQVSNTGAISRFILATGNTAGDWRAYAIVEDGGAVSFNAGTVAARVRIEFAGSPGSATKNAIVRISRQLFKPYKWDIRRRVKRPGGAANPNPPPWVVHPPGSDLGVEPSPAPPEVPETRVVPSPDRPRSVGTPLEADLTFEGPLPAPWAEREEGGATFDVDATAAISGNLGARLRKTAAHATNLGRASVSRQLPLPAGLEARHDSGISASHRVASLSGDHYLDFDRIGRPGDEAYIAYLRYGNARETAELTIDRAPNSFGTVGVTLDGFLYNVSTNAIKETVSLSVTGAPTSPGTVGVALGMITGGTATRQVAAGGTQEEFTVNILSMPYALGYVRVFVGSQYVQVYVGPAWTRTQIATALASRGLPGWSVRAAGTVVYFTSRLPGPQPNATFSPGSSGVRGAVTITTQGANETATEFAQRIRDANFPGWTVGGTGTTVVLTAVEGGPRPDASVDVGSTGAVVSLTTTQQGAVDSATDLATRIRATAFPNWATGGSGRTITFTHNLPGQRANAQFDGRATGAAGTMVTTQKGIVGDLIAYCRDLSDPSGRRSRRVMTGLGPTTVWNTDVTVAGAGTPEAIVSVWGSVGAAPKQLLARWEGVDLTGYPAGHVEPGVWRDSDRTATWDVHVDGVRITDRGESYFRDHDYRGRRINQLHYHGVPGQPTIPGMPLSGYREAVVPGQLYSLGGFYRWAGVPESRPARPTFVTAYTSRGRARRLLDITGPAGISGDSGGWQELSQDGADAIEIPRGCHEIGIESEGVGQGTIVVQELACSPGTAVKRTPLRTLTGSYRPTFRRRPARKPSFVYYGERRTLLETDASAEVGATVAVSYRSGPTADGPWSVWYADPVLVPEDDFVQVDVSGTGMGTSTFSVRAGSPRLVYETLMGEESVPVLLREDGSEFLGGALLIDPNEWSAPPDVGVNRLPGGRLRRAKLYDGAEQLPENSLLVFTEDDKREIEETCRTALFRADMWGESLTLAFSGPVMFQRQGAKTRDRDGHYRSLYVATLPWAEVRARAELPRGASPGASLELVS